MARDLEASKKSTSEPKLSDILKGAQRKVENKVAAEGPISQGEDATNEPSPEERGGKIAGRILENDFLPIEETVSEIKKADEKDSSYKETHKEPPANLPTDSIPSAPEKSAPVPRPTPKKELLTPPQPLNTARDKQTPEEILGLPASPKPLAPQREIPTAPPRPITPQKSSKSPPYRPSSSKLQPVSPKTPRLDSPKTRQANRGERVSLPTFKFSLIAGGLSILLVSLVGTAYWVFFIDKTPTPIVEPSDGSQAPTIVIEQPKPKTLIQYNKEHGIEINKLTYSALKLNIDALKDVQYLPESISYIPIKYTTGSEVKYLELEEFFNTLGIFAPENIAARENYNIFLYSQKTNAQDECTSAGIKNTACWGPRLGVVIDTANQDRSFIKETMLEWEKTIVNDLNPFILAEYEAPENATFKSGLYKNFNTRYINLPLLASADQAISVPTTSIDWILADDYLIIATSKDAARAAINGLAD